MPEYSPAPAAEANPVLFCSCPDVDESASPDPPRRRWRPPAAGAPPARPIPAAPPLPLPGIRRERLRLLRRERQRHRRPDRDRAPARRRRRRRAASPRPPSAGGRFSFSSVPNGAQTAQASPASLPAYFTPGAPLSVDRSPDRRRARSPRSSPIGSRAQAERLPGLRRQHHLRRRLLRRLRLPRRAAGRPAGLLGKGRRRERRGPGHEEQQGRVAGGRQPRHPSTGLPADPLRDERLERRGVPQRVPVLHDRRPCARWSCRRATRGPSPSSGRSRP